MIEMSGTIDTSTDDYKPYYSAEEDEGGEEEEEEEEEEAAPAFSLMDFKPPFRKKHRGRPRKHPERLNIPKRPRGRPRKFPMTGKLTLSF